MRRRKERGKHDESEHGPRTSGLAGTKLPPKFLPTTTLRTSQHSHAGLSRQIVSTMELQVREGSCIVVPQYTTGHDKKRHYSRFASGRDPLLFCNFQACWEVRRVLVGRNLGGNFGPRTSSNVIMFPSFLSSPHRRLHSSIAYTSLQPLRETYRLTLIRQQGYTL